MCDYFDWDRDDEEKLEARELLKDALTQQFNGIYGTEVEDLESWKGLCRAIGISPIPDELEACREVVRDTHVNIVDLVDKPNTRRRVKIFHSEEALSGYTKDTGKFFPKENAYAGGLLKYLLRHIMNPSSEPRPTRKRRRR